MAYVKTANDALGNNAGTAVNSIASYPNATVAGNLLLCLAGNKTSTTELTITDNLGATWTRLIFNNATATGQCLGLYGKIAAGGETTVSSNGAALSASTVITIHEYSGNQASLTGIVDASQGTATNSLVTSSSTFQPSVTTTNANDLVFTGVLLSSGAGSNPTWTGATGLSQDPNTTTWLMGDAYQIETATGTYTPSVAWTNTRKFQQITVGLLPASSVVNNSITQVAGTITFSGGTQTVASVQNVAIDQTGSNGVITFAGGTQSVAGSGVINASIAQLAGTITFTGNTQVVASIQNVVLAQLAGTITFTGATWLALYDGFESGFSSWTQAGSTITQDTSIFYAGSNSAKFNTAATASLTNVTLAANTNDVAFFNIQFYQTGNPSANTQIVRLLNSSSQIVSGFKVNTTGTLQGKNADNTDGTVVGNVNSNAWNYLTWSYDPTTGINIAKLNGNTAITWTNTSTASWSKLQIGVISAATYTIYFDEVNLNYSGNRVDTSNISAITQTFGALTFSGGTQAVNSIQLVSLAQLAASLTVNGGTQTLTSMQNSSIAQFAATLLFTGNTQSVLVPTSVLITQLAALLRLSGGTQVVAVPAVVHNFDDIELITNVLGNILSGSSDDLEIITPVSGSVSTGHSDQMDKIDTDSGTILTQSDSQG